MKPVSVDELAKITPSDKLTLIDKYASQIAGAYRKSVGALVETGQKLGEAHDALSAIWGKNSTAFGWKLFLSTRCNFSESTASKLRKIAANTAIANPKNWATLPPGLEHLYTLAQMYSAKDIDQKLKQKSIRESMTLREISQLPANTKGRPPAKRYRLTISMELSQDDQVQLKTDIETFEIGVEPLLKNLPRATFKSNLGDLL